MASGSPRREPTPSHSPEWWGRPRSVAPMRPAHEQALSAQERMIRRSARQDPVLYTWTELPIAQQHAALALVRDSERKRRQARRRSIAVTMLLVVLIVAFVVVVLGQLLAFSP